MPMSRLWRELRGLPAATSTTARRSVPRAPGGSPAMRHSSPSSTARAACSTWGERRGRSRPRCAGRSTLATKAVASSRVVRTAAGSMLTTSFTGHGVGRPKSTIWSCSARVTTDSCTRVGSERLEPPMARSPSAGPTAGQFPPFPPPLAAAMRSYEPTTGGRSCGSIPTPRSRSAVASASIASWRCQACWRELGLEALRDRRHHAGDAVADEARLLVALYLEGEAGHHLPPAAALLVDRDDLGPAADPAVDGDRGGEADLVPAVVDTEGEAARGDQVLAEAVDQRQGEVAVGDRRAEGALVLGLLDVDVDPLVVPRELGEGVDVVLGDRTPIARADLLPEQRLHPLDSLHLDGGHRSRV